MDRHTDRSIFNSDYATKILYQKKRFYNIHVTKICCLVYYSNPSVYYVFALSIAPGRFFFNRLLFEFIFFFCYISI